jgi:hypothetical protein
VSSNKPFQHAACLINKSIHNLKLVKLDNQNGIAPKNTEVANPVSQYQDAFSILRVNELLHLNDLAVFEPPHAHVLIGVWLSVEKHSVASKLIIERL